MDLRTNSNINNSDQLSTRRAHLDNHKCKLLQVLRIFKHHLRTGWQLTQQRQRFEREPEHVQLSTLYMLQHQVYGA